MQAHLEMEWDAAAQSGQVDLGVASGGLLEPAMQIGPGAFRVSCSSTTMRLGRAKSGDWRHRTTRRFAR